MTQELDKNGRPKIYCKNCGKRMAHTYQQQYYGTSGYLHHNWWGLKEKGEVFDNRQEAELRLQELLNTGHRNRGFGANANEPLKVEFMEGYNHSYGSRPDTYYVEYSEYVCEPIPFQFHSMSCMHEFLQRPDIIEQILPIIEANKREPIIPEKKPRKKREAKIDLPDYDAMATRIKEITL